MRQIRISLGTIILLVLASSAFAAPIRVGIFKGTGWRWTGSTHTAGRAIDSMLANPDSANLGPSLVKSPDGFVTRIFGVVDTPSASTQPTLEQKTAFLNALDSLDVIVFPSNSNFGVIFDQAPQREKLEQFFKTRGVVSLAWSMDRSTSWGAWDSLHGARFSGWMYVGMGTVRHDSAAAPDPEWRFLNRGLPDTARFHDEWVSFTTSATAIRAVPGLKVSMNLDEASISGGGNNRRMGDHPNSWYRELPEGGRFFYSGNGYHSRVFTGAAVTDSAGDTTVPANNFFRRQLYNAILWAAGYNENTGTALRGERFPVRFSDISRLSLSGGTLTVSLLRDGAHTVEILALDGRLVDTRRGSGRADYALEGLRKGSVYILAVTTTAGRYTRKVLVP